MLVSGRSLESIARRMLTGALVALVTLLALPALAQAAGTITVKKAGSRTTANNTTNGYAAALAGAVFEFAPYNGATDPRLLTSAQLAALTWQTHTCTTSAAGSCTLTTDNNGGTIDNGRYLVREKTAPAGWDDVLTSTLNYSGGSSGASPARNYLADVTISGQNDPTANVSPTNGFAGESGDEDTPASQLFIDVKDNAPFPQACGLNVMLLLDESGSIGSEPGEAAAYRDAAQAFVNALANTPTKLKIGSFAASAAFQGGGTGTIYDLDTGAGVTNANNAITNVYASVGGGTNWDAGMQLAATDDPNVDIDLVVFITDGNPTVRQPVSSADDSNTASNVNLLDLTYGIASANLAKAAEGGQKILSVGVGSGVTKENLKVMSGPNEFPADQTNPDFAAISDETELAAALKKIANLLCGARVHVRKLTDGDPNPSNPRAGWTFDPAKTLASPLAVTLAPDPLVTDATEVNDLIRVDGIPAGGAPGITLAETMQAGYAFAAASCQKAAPTDPNRWPNPADGVGSQTLDLTTINRGDDLWCTYRNKRKATVTIVKNAVPDDAQDFSFTTTGLGGWAPVLDDDGIESTANGGKLSSESMDVVSFGQKTITETGVSGWDLDSLVCQNGTQAPVPFPDTSTASINVQPGDAWVCTYTNKKVDLEISKSADAAQVSAGDPIGFTVTVTNNGPGTAKNVQVSDPLPGGSPAVTWSIDGQPAGDPCQITGAAGSQTLSCTLGNLGDDATRTVHVTASTTADACSSYDNTATVTADNAPSDNDDATIQCQTASVTVDKTATDQTIDAGEQAQFTITVTSDGPGTAKDVKLSDPLPAGLSWTVGGADAGDCADPVVGNTLDCSFGDLAPGQSRTVTLTATTSFRACADYPNVATVSGDNFPDKQANATIHCRTPAIVRIDKVVLGEEGSTTEFGFTSNMSPNDGDQSTSFQLSDSDPMAVYTVRPGEYSITEDDPRGQGYVLSGASCAPTEQMLDDRANVNDPEDRTVGVELGEGDDVTCTFTNTRLTSGIEVVKSPKSQTVYADGTASYTYKVTNTGTSDLANVTVGDDRCSPLTRTDAGNNDAENLLEQGETWTYTCSVSAAALFGSSSAPVTNTVTASGVDRTEKTVTDTDTAVTNLLVPGIAIDKTGPATAVAGALLTYDMAVTNTGNTSFPAAEVKLTDTVVTPPGLTCIGDLATPKDKKGDQTPNELNPGETWVYQCQVQTASGQTLVDNKADVTGKDTGGKTVSATDNAQTTLTQPGTVIQPDAFISSRARMSGSVGCVTARYARASVSGSPIRRVTFYVNGKLAKRLTKPNGGRNFQLRYRTKTLKYGTYKVRAVVQFQNQARPQSRTLRLQFNRCRPRVVKPTFTG